MVEGVISADWVIFELCEGEEGQSKESWHRGIAGHRWAMTFYDQPLVCGCCS